MHLFVSARLIASLYAGLRSETSLEPSRNATFDIPSNYAPLTDWCLGAINACRAEPSTTFTLSVRVTGANGRQSFSRRSLSALPTTDTELRLMAAAATMGLSNRPKAGYSKPAAIGMANTL
jgi:hypothetical protein